MEDAGFLPFSSQGETRSIPALRREMMGPSTRWAPSAPRTTCLCREFELSNRDGDASIAAGESPRLGNRRREAIDILRGLEIIPLDSGPLAGFASLCRHTRTPHSNLFGRANTLERAGHLSLARCFRRNASPLTWNDSGVWRSRIVSALQD